MKKITDLQTIQVKKIKYNIPFIKNINHKIVINDSDESSFGYFGKPEERNTSSI